MGKSPILARPATLAFLLLAVRIAGAQSTDLANAIHWVCGEKQCDRERIGLWGSSYSGGHVVYAAAHDARVKATVSQVPGMDSRFVLAGKAKEQTYDEATKRTHGEIG